MSSRRSESPSEARPALVPRIKRDDHSGIEARGRLLT